MKYMTERFKEQHDEKTVKTIGPVITISREFGCYATKIAEPLSTQLNKIYQKANKPAQWRYISKEILEKAAEELKVNPENISHVFEAEAQSLLGDIILSFSNRHYNSDANIKRTLSNIVRSYAEEGQVIIVGRASCIIAKDIPNSLHIRLFAPFDWRVREIQEHYKLTLPEAKSRVLEIDEKRDQFMAFFRNNTPQNDFFDIAFNRMILTEEQIVKTILDLLSCKNYFM